MSPGNAAAPGGGPGDGASWDREPTPKVTRSCDTSEQADRVCWVCQTEPAQVHPTGQGSACQRCPEVHKGGVS